MNYDAVSSFADINGARVGIKTHKNSWSPQVRGLVLYPFRKGYYIFLCKIKYFSQISDGKNML
jgi:hypothetical protein